MFWRAVTGWLSRVPVEDPVDKRNAPFVQVVFLLLGVLIPGIKLYYLYLVAFHNVELRYKSFDYWIDLITDAFMTATVWAGVYLIRRGRFGLAVGSFLTVFLGSMLLGYVSVGMHNLRDDPLPLLILTFAGQVLGRRLLWLVYSAVLLCLACGVLSDGFRFGHGDVLAVSVGQASFRALLYLLIAVLMDRTVAALRESLAESKLHGRQLERLNADLRHEMQERERVQQQLIHAQKMEAVGRVASGVAHDFDNVLNIILGYAMRRERLADQGPTALLDAFGGVELAARRALAVSRKLLNFSRQDVPHPETFDAGTTVSELKPMLRQLFTADVRLSVAVGRQPMPIRMDKGQFELLLLNVAANARDAMPDGGRFTVRMERGADGRTLELALADDGHGMPAEVAARIFEPFYTTKPIGSGTGLGLAVVHDMVLANQGDIAVDSVPGGGTCFLIRLPLALAPADAKPSGTCEAQVRG